jgi:hypothetical protein
LINGGKNRRKADNVMNKRPLVLRLREAKENILAAVNAAIKEQDLPCYLIEPIIAEMHNQVSASAMREYEIAKQTVEKTAEAGGEDNGP